MRNRVAPAREGSGGRELQAEYKVVLALFVLGVELRPVEGAEGALDRVFSCLPGSRHCFSEKQLIG